MFQMIGIISTTINIACCSYRYIITIHPLSSFIIHHHSSPLSSLFCWWLENLPIPFSFLTQWNSHICTVCIMMIFLNRFHSITISRNISFKSPGFACSAIEKVSTCTRGNSIDRVVTAHQSGCTCFSNTRFKWNLKPTWIIIASHHYYHISLLSLSW